MGLHGLVAILIADTIYDAPEWGIARGSRADKGVVFPFFHPQAPA